MTTEPTSRPPSPALLDVFKRIPLEPVRGEGVWIDAADGKRYLDFYGGHAVALLGNAHPALVRAVSEQAQTLFFQSNVVDLAVRDRAAEKLVAFANQGLEGAGRLSRVFFVNSGAEANENALRIAFLATGRARVVCLAGAFHGRTAAAGALTANNDKWYAFPSKPFGITVVPWNDPAALEQAIGPDVAAVIVEPVQGVGGARAVSREFMVRAREATQKHGALLIFDEVQSGMGRTGYPFAAQAYGVVPDVVSVAKGIAGGFPAGAVLVGEALAAKIKKGDLGTTFGGGPLACALVEAVVDAVEREELLPRVRRLSARLQKECLVGPVEGVQGMGFLLGLRVRPKASEVLAFLRSKQILAGEASDPHIVRLLPPLILEDAHVDQLVATLKEMP